MLLVDLLSLAVLGPAWHLAGRAAQRLQLPAITGIMLVRCQCCRSVHTSGKDWFSSSLEQRGASASR